jgi:hypothetical protein
VGISLQPSDGPGFLADSENCLSSAITASLSPAPAILYL